LQGLEYDQLFDEIEELLNSAKHPQTSLPLFNRVLRGKEHYQGTVESFIPDLLVLPGNYMSAAIPRQLRIYDSIGWATGDHDISGNFIAAGNGIEQNTIESAQLIDMAPTILFICLICLYPMIWMGICCRISLIQITLGLIH
jgi:hypothetical protein